MVIKAGDEGEVAVAGEEANKIMYEAWAIQLISRPVSDRCTMITFIPHHFFINTCACLFRFTLPRVAVTTRAPKCHEFGVNRVTRFSDPAQVSSGLNLLRAFLGEVTYCPSYICLHATQCRV